MYLLYQKLGISAIVGATACMLTMIPLQFLIGKTMSKNAKHLSVSTFNVITVVYKNFLSYFFFAIKVLLLLLIAF